ncbi:nitroreductase family protein [Synoicihabitans lomoniglobus]|uniref:Nitroreductase family protein n=1 Tax=Synoicihabitans lomoniglobus TaxID=2909285 RepID=A0AAF0CQG3_9BACT|nr:nitroreductase family protein [Opitutaceae bacterium LMO-M01]WED66185.1 nitroreductase family protein [Opitutaceae bacterium LMO-M01]
MNPPLESMLETRSTAGRFDSTRTLPDGVVEKLIHLATRAPSAFNLQNWRFIALESTPAKAQLKAVAFGQQQVVDAAVTFIVCGELESHRHLFARLQPAVDQGILPAALQQGWTDMAGGLHTDNPGLQRDEAFRSASLAAMVLMLAANSMGLAAGALSGFDPQALAESFQLSSHDVPVMLVTVGYPASGNWPQKPRRAVTDVLERR